MWSVYWSVYSPDSLCPVISQGENSSAMTRQGSSMSARRACAEATRWRGACGAACVVRPRPLLHNFHCSLRTGMRHYPAQHRQMISGYAMIQLTKRRQEESQSIMGQGGGTGCRRYLWLCKAGTNYSSGESAPRARAERGTISGGRFAQRTGFGRYTGGRHTAGIQGDESMCKRECVQKHVQS